MMLLYALGVICAMMCPGGPPTAAPMTEPMSRRPSDPFI